MTEEADDAITDPPDYALLIRGAPMIESSLVRRARRDFNRLGGIYGVSAAAASDPAMTLAELVSAAELPHVMVRRSTPGRVRGAGFRVYRTGKWPHCTIDLGDDPTEDVASALIAAFDPAETSPRSETT